MPLLTFLGFFIFIYVAFFSPLFTVKNIVCTQDFEPCNNPFILAEADTLKGQNIFFLNSNNFIKLLTQGDFQTRSGEIKKILPNTLILSLQSVYPIMALHVEGETRFATLDSSLRIIRLLESNPNVPIIELSSPISLQIGQPVQDQSLVANITFAKDVVRRIPNIIRLVMQGDDLILTLSDKIVATLTIHREAEEQIDALKAVLGDATIREGLRKVDVRFAQPVLVKD